MASVDESAPVNRLETLVEDSLGGAMASVVDRGLSRVGGAGSGNGRKRSRETERRRKLRQCIERLVAARQGRRISLDRRAHRRFEYREPLVIIPVDDDTGRPQADRSFSGFGIDISQRGFGFLSRQLVPTRRAVVACEVPNKQRVYLLFQPRWVRFTQGGWYHIGARLLEVLPTSLSVPLPPEAERPVEPPPPFDRYLAPRCPELEHWSPY